MIEDIIYNEIFSTLNLKEYSNIKCINKRFNEIYTKKLKEFLKEKPWAIAKIINPSEEIQLFLSCVAGNYIRYFPNTSFKIQTQYCFYNFLNLIYISKTIGRVILLTFENYKKEYEMKKLDLNP